MKEIARQMLASLKTDGTSWYFYQVDGCTNEMHYFDTDEQAIAWFKCKVK